MGKHKIRHNKTCQNCGAFVEDHFCPKCGQENSESRQSFHHLFTHFVFDLFHYDSSFWRTAKYLFLSPGKLSVEYMNGKRKSYVNPFTLYIFISFLTFFVPSVLPDYESDKEGIIAVKAENKDTLQEKSNINIVVDHKKFDAEKLDSLYRTHPQEDQVVSPDGFIFRTIVALAENIDDEYRKEKAIEFLIHHIPKTLFVYMPVFAFWLWLLNDKKKRYYFDSGIFTLHFFSVVLFSITVCQVLSCLFGWIKIDFLNAFLWTLMVLYVTFYFFKGCRVFYGGNRWFSYLRSFALMIINLHIIIVILVLYLFAMIYAVYT